MQKKFKIVKGKNFKAKILFKNLFLIWRWFYCLTFIRRVKKKKTVFRASALENKLTLLWRTKPSILELELRTFNVI